LRKGRSGKKERKLREGKGRGKEKTWGTFPFRSLKLTSKKGSTIIWLFHIKIYGQPEEFP
jgi:hypothetical protein